MNLKDLSYYAMIGGALTIILWAFLKSIGIINTPNWLTLLPYFAGGVSALGIAYHLGKIVNGIERLLLVEKRFNKLENEHDLVMAGKIKLH